jgi:hypothetical protein
MTTYRITDGAFFQGGTFKSQKNAVAKARSLAKDMRMDMFVVGYSAPYKVHKAVSYRKTR